MYGAVRKSLFFFLKKMFSGPLPYFEIMPDGKAKKTRTLSVVDDNY